MAIITDAQKNKDGINAINQISNFVNWINTLTGIVNTFGDLKTTYTDPADKAEIDLKLNNILVI